MFLMPRLFIRVVFSLLSVELIKRRKSLPSKPTAVQTQQWIFFHVFGCCAMRPLCDLLASPKKDIWKNGDRRKELKAGQFQDFAEQMQIIVRNTLRRAVLTPLEVFQQSVTSIPEEKIRQIRAEMGKSERKECIPAIRRAALHLKVGGKFISQVAPQNFYSIGKEKQEISFLSSLLRLSGRKRLYSADLALAWIALGLVYTMRRSIQ